MMLIFDINRRVRHTRKKTVEIPRIEKYLIPEYFENDIMFKDLYEAGDYYPIKGYLLENRFNTLYHLLKNNSSNKIYYTNGDIRIKENYEKIKKLLNVTKNINIVENHLGSLYKHSIKFDSKYSETMLNTKTPVYKCIFLCREARAYRLMFIDEMFGTEGFTFSYINPDSFVSEDVNQIVSFDDENLKIDEKSCLSDYDVPIYTKNWNSSEPKFLTENDHLFGSKDDVNRLCKYAPNEYFESLIEVVGETYVSVGMLISEKTTKPIFFKKPFICIAAKGFHQYLEKELGFELYRELFDYSFDSQSLEIRFKSIVHQIKNLLESNSLFQLQKKIEKLENKMIMNKKRLVEIVKNYKEVTI